MEEIRIDSFKGIAPKYGDNLPLGFAQSAINCSLSKSKLAPLAKNTLVQADVNHYNSFTYHCQTWEYGNNRFYCPWKIGVLDLLMYKDASGYLKKKVSWIITKTDISFDSVSKEIRSVAGDFNIFSLGAGMTFIVSGSPGNSTTFTVSTTVATTTTVITVQGAVITEVAGASITIKVCKEDYLGQTRQAKPTTAVGAYAGTEVGEWVQKAPQFQNTTVIHTILEYNSEIYGASEQNGNLYKWDGVESWILVASQYNTETIHPLCVFNNKIYAGCLSGRLLEWDGASAWILKAETIVGEWCTHSLYVFNGKLYGGTSPNGKLLEWDGVSAWAVKATAAGVCAITRLFELSGQLYAVTAEDLGTTSASCGNLLQWNGTNAWVQVAPTFVLEKNLRGAVVFNSQIYAGSEISSINGSGTGGLLLQWNGTNAWVQKAALLNSEKSIRSLLVHNSYLYGSTGTTGRLFKWNGTNAWSQVADQTGSETGMLFICEFNTYIYGVSTPLANLFLYTPDQTTYDVQYLITLTRNVGGHTDESGPNAVSTAVNVLQGVEYQNITVTKPAWAGLGTDAFVTYWNLYRLSNATGAWMLVAQIPWATAAYVDAVADADLGETPPSYYTSDQDNEIIWDIPIKNLDGITTIPISGIIFGWKGSTLYWSEPGYPDAWVAFYTMNFPAAIKNCIPYGLALAVLTSVGPFRVDGTHPETLQQSPPLGNNPAMSVLGCCRSSKGVLYLSDSGIVLFDMSTPTVLTDEGFGEDWFKTNISPTGAVMIEVDNIGYLFHSGGALVVDFRAETPIPTTLSEVIYGVYRKEDDDDLYVMDAAGIQKFGTAVGTKEMTWKSGDLLGDHPEEKTFIETELMGSAVAVTVTNYVNGTVSKSAALSMDTTRNKRLGFLDDLCVGRAAQIQIYKAAHATLTPPELEITEAIVRYTR